LRLAPVWLTHRKLWHSIINQPSITGCSPTARGKSQRFVPVNAESTVLSRSRHHYVTMPQTESEKPRSFIMAEEKGEAKPSK